MSILERHAIVPRLNGANSETYKAIFRHPVVHNLTWGEVHRLLEAVADVMYGHNGNITATRRDQTLHLPSNPAHDRVSQAAVKQVRDFLERSDLATVAPAADGRHWLVVIDHDAARVYHTEMHGSVPVRVSPSDPGGHGRHIHVFRTDGKHRPLRTEFYAAVADLLRGADRILLFGHGVGESRGMDELYADLVKRHPALADRVIGRVVIDPTHTTEDQILARAREFYAALPS